MSGVASMKEAVARNSIRRDSKTHSIARDIAAIFDPEKVNTNANLETLSDSHDSDRFVGNFY